VTNEEKYQLLPTIYKSLTIRSWGRRQWENSYAMLYSRAEWGNRP